MMKGKRAKTVDEYISRQPTKVRAALKALRKTIKQAAPQAIEKIGYGMPGYNYKGPVVYFAVFKNHCSLFGTSTTILKQFTKELKAFDVSGSTIHFTPEKQIPKALVKKIVRERVRQNEARAKAKAKK